MLTKAARWLAANVLLPAGIAVALLLLLEGGCRVGLRLRTGEWPVTEQERGTRQVRAIGAAYHVHPFLSVAGRPGAVLRLPGHVATFNSRGTRGPEVEMPKPKGRFRVVCEGGSTTFDLLAADDAATWPARLARLLGPGADVVNGGFPGWTSVQNLVALELRDVDLSPDLVVVFCGINDTQPAGHVPFFRDYSVGHGEILPRILGAVPPPLPLVSRLVFVEWLRDRIGRRPRRVDGSGYAPAWSWRGGARRDAMPEDAVDVFRRNVRSMAGVSAAFGSPVLFVAQTARIREGQVEADREYLESWTPGLTWKGYLDAVRRYNVAARELGDEGVVSFLDPFASGDFTDADFSDPIHFSVEGSERFAGLVAAEVERVRARLPAPPLANMERGRPSGPRHE
jgi:lysophospholipase L1-like esterase